VHHHCHVVTAPGGDQFVTAGDCNAWAAQPRQCDNRLGHRRVVDEVMGSNRVQQGDEVGIVDGDKYRHGAGSA
jgi:hypothetical protein